MAPPTICTVCSTKINYNYCENCGQKKINKKTSVLSLIKDIFVNFFSLEKSIPANLLRLIITPDKLINNYFSGFRKYYPSPGKFLLYALTFAAFHIAFVSKEIFGFYISATGVSPQIVMLTFLISLLALISYLTFIRTKNVFSKHLISTIYFTSCFFIITLLISDIFLLFSDAESNKDSLFFILFILSILIWNSIVFSPPKKYISLIISIGVQIFIITGITLIIIYSGLIVWD